MKNYKSKTKIRSILIKSIIITIIMTLLNNMVFDIINSPLNDILLFNIITFINYSIFNLALGIIKYSKSNS